MIGWYIGSAAYAALLLYFIALMIHRRARAGYLDQHEKRFAAWVVADSVSPEGVRVTTMEWTYPRFIHAEVMTHRIARSAMSSRALPVMTVWKQVLYNPAGPIEWGRSSRSMQAEKQLWGWRKGVVRQLWYVSRYPILAVVWVMMKVKLHKQVANRLLEPWQWMTLVMTASQASWKNIWRLRCHPDAQPEFMEIADKARGAWYRSEPVKREWHLPFIGEYELNRFGINLNTKAVSVPTEVLQISAARCARTSYGKNIKIFELSEDMALYHRLADSTPPHTNPLEHPCIAHWDKNYRSGPLVGWVQYREQVDPHWSTFFPKEDARAPESSRHAHYSNQCPVCTGKTGREPYGGIVAETNPWF